MDKGDDPLCLSLYIFSRFHLPSRRASPSKVLMWPRPGQRLTNLDISDYLALKIVFTIINYTINYYALYAEEETNFIYQIPVF